MVYVRAEARTLHRFERHAGVKTAASLRRGRSALMLRTGVTVTGFVRDGDRVTGVTTDHGDILAGAVVNAAGTWGGASKGGWASPGKPMSAKA